MKEEAEEPQRGIERVQRQRKAPTRLQDETRFNFDVRATGSRHAPKKQPRMYKRSEFSEDDDDFYDDEGDGDDDGDVETAAGRRRGEQLSGEELRARASKIPVGRKLDLPVVRGRGPDVAVGMKFYRHFESGFALLTQVVDQVGDPNDEDSLEFTIRYEDGGRDRVGFGDLQILIANGDTKRQAALAYDKDICQICLRADEGAWWG